MLFSRKKKINTKEKILSKIKGDYELLKYIPDGINLQSLSKRFILTLLHEKKPNVYKELIKEESELILKRRSKRLDDYEIEVPQDVAQDLLKQKPAIISKKEEKSTFVKIFQNNQKVEGITKVGEWMYN